MRLQKLIKLPRLQFHYKLRLQIIQRIRFCSILISSFQCFVLTHPHMTNSSFCTHTHTSSRALIHRLINGVINQLLWRESPRRAASMCVRRYTVLCGVCGSQKRIAIANAHGAGGRWDNEHNGWINISAHIRNRFQVLRVGGRGPIFCAHAAAMKVLGIEFSTFWLFAGVRWLILDRSTRRSFPHWPAPARASFEQSDCRPVEFHLYSKE